MNSKNVLILAGLGVVLAALTWISVFIYIHKIYTVYGFFSFVRPMPFQVVSTSRRFMLDFPPQEAGLGIIALDLARESREQSGVVMTKLTDTSGKKIFLREDYSTTHVDSSKPLLISRAERSYTESRTYRLTIATEPPSLLPEYLVRGGLQAQGVYFMDPKTWRHDLGQVMRLIRWKITEVSYHFAWYSIILLIVLPLVTPTAIAVARYEYSRRRVGEKSSRIARAVRTSLLVMLARFIVDERSVRAYTSRQVVALYGRFISHQVRASYAWCRANPKLSGDFVLVALWALANLTFAVTKTVLSDTHYFGFMASYIVFAFLRQVDARAHYVAALISLLYCPYFLSQGQDAAAEKMAIFVYGFMVAGALADFIALVRSKKRISE